MTPEDFIQKEVPVLLDRLQADTPARWGSMHASAMLHHLADTIRMALHDVPRPVDVPEGKEERYQQFLLSDRPFARELAMPGSFKAEATVPGTFEENKAYFEDQLEAFCARFAAEPGFTSIHQAFGRLDYTHWVHLLAKHIRHHFTQFGLLE